MRFIFTYSSRCTHWGELCPFPTVSREATLSFQQYCCHPRHLLHSSLSGEEHWCSWAPLGNPRPYGTFTLCFDHKYDYLGWPYSWFTYFTSRGFLSTAPNQNHPLRTSFATFEVGRKDKLLALKAFQGIMAISQKTFIKGSWEALACIWP